MPLDFPNSPTLNQSYTTGGLSWSWDGVKWLNTPQAGATAAVNNIGRNLLHNPLFNVAQRGAGPWTPANSYTADRWLMTFTGGSLQTTIFAQAPGGAVSGDEQSIAVLGFTVTGTAGSGDFAQCVQRIEGVSRLSGKTVTLSFYANASAALKIGANLAQVFGTGGSPSAAVSTTGQSVTLVAGGVWSRYSITFSIPSIVGKTLGTTAGTDFTQLSLWFSSGAINNANAGNIGVQSGNVNIWGVQLEIGSVATPLEKPDPRYDLANCQRFYILTQGGFAFYATAGASISMSISLPVFMRAAPTASLGINYSTNVTGFSLASLNGAVVSLNGTATATGSTVLNAVFQASADL